MTDKRKVYVASSWRNSLQPMVVDSLRKEGHEVYDFRNPAPGKCGFAWSAIDEDWLNWNPRQFIHRLEESPIAADGFRLDRDALNWCDTCVLVLPCGRSAHLEAGYAAGQGKDTIILLQPEKFEPELMYLLGSGLVTSIEECKIALRLSRSRMTVLGYPDKA